MSNKDHTSVWKTVLNPMFTMRAHPWSMITVREIATRFSTGTIAFASAGYLVFAILSDNGASSTAQQEWRDAAARTVPLQPTEQTTLAARDPLPDSVDMTITGSIRNIADKASKVKKQPTPEQELTVLELIRNNADVSPGVTNGTDRVSIIVERGDTLFGISQRHGISIDALARLNGLQEPYTIKLGQTLYLAR